MAKPMTHTQFTDLLKKWNIATVDNSHGDVKWYNHNRNHKGPWGPSVNGVGNHHTGAKDNSAGRSVLWYGYASLPGPLCHGGITADGKVLLNGWGRVNHFGLGDSDVLNKVIAEEYDPSKLKPKKADVDGNSRFYGFEWMYDGKSNPETHYPKLYQCAVRVNAAILTWHGWSPESAIGHGNWQPGKWDPGVASGKFFDLARFQNHVEQAMKEGPNPKKPDLPTRPTNPPKGTTGTTNIVRVKKDDTLMGIAEKHLGDPKRYLDLIPANPSLLRPLKVGEIIKLPKK